MARVFYSTGQFEKAAKYYDRVPLDSNLWLSALEASWTYFRWNNQEKALNLHTLTSPFFKDEYVPEAGILEGVIFIPTVTTKDSDALYTFRTTYEPLRDELKKHLTTYSDHLSSIGL